MPRLLGFCLINSVRSSNVMRANSHQLPLLLSVSCQLNVGMMMGTWISQMQIAEKLAEGVQMRYLGVQGLSVNRMVDKFCREPTASNWW